MFYKLPAARFKPNKTINKNEDLRMKVNQKKDWLKNIRHFILIDFSPKNDKIVDLTETRRKYPNNCHPNLKCQNS